LLPGFDAALDGLTANILLMGALVRRSLCNAKTGLLRRDVDDCAAVIADDEEVDLLEKTVDKEGTAILLRFQPMTFDLRRVLATISPASTRAFAARKFSLKRRMKPSWSTIFASAAAAIIASHSGTVIA